MMKAPAVYRFVAPDGRSYVGAVQNSRWRANYFGRYNARLKEAFLTHPPETFRYEVLENLPPESSVQELAEAEQRHMDRLRTWDPEHGFNIFPAIWTGDGPAQQAARRWKNEILVEIRSRSPPKKATARERANA